MWREDKISLVDFYKRCKYGILEDDYLLLICLISRKADAPQFFKDIREYWSSFHDITGNKILFLFAGEEVKGMENEYWVTYTYPENNENHRNRRGKAIIYNSSSVVIGNKPNINYYNKLTGNRIKIGHPRLESYDRFESAHSLEIREMVKYLELDENDIPVINISYLPTLQSANIKLTGRESIYEVIKKTCIDFQNSDLSQYTFREIRKLKDNYYKNKNYTRTNKKIDALGFKNDFSRWSHKIETNSTFEKENDILESIQTIKKFNKDSSLEELNKCIKILKTKLPDTIKYQRMLSFADRYLNKLFTNYPYQQKTSTANGKIILPKKFYNKFNYFIEHTRSDISDSEFNKGVSTEKHTEIISSIDDSLKNIRKDTIQIKIQNKEIISLSREQGIVIGNIKTELNDIAKEIFKEIEEIDDSKIKTIWTHKEFQDSLDTIIKKLDGLGFSKEDKKNITEKMSSTDLSLKHKLKFIIPLFFFKYEAEIELSNKNKLPRSWNQWVRLFVKSNTAANKG